MSGMLTARRLELYDQAEAQIEEGLSPVEVLEDFSKRATRRGRKKTAEAAAGMARAMQDGKTFAESLGKSVPKWEIAIVNAGELAGKLPNSLRLILEVRERTDRINRAMVAAALSPLTLAIALWATLVVIADLMPQFESIVPLNLWRGWAKVMHMMTLVVTGWAAYAVLAAIGVAAVAAILARHRWTGKGRAFADRWIFPFTLFRDVDGYIWMATYSALQQAGISETDALQMQIKTATPYMQSRLRPVLLMMRNGHSLPSALRVSKTGFPSLDLIDQIGAFAGFATFPDKLQKISIKFAASMERRLTIQTVAVGAVFTMITYAVIIVVQLGSNELQSLMMSSVGVPN